MAECIGKVSCVNEDRVKKVRYSWRHGKGSEENVPVVWCGPLSKHYLPPASHQPTVPKRWQKLRENIS